VSARWTPIRTHRIYDEAGDDPGPRVLIDRLWPRGVSKETAGLAFWARGCAPSNELRRWYGHDPARWEEFQARYFAELDAAPEALAELERAVPPGPLTLLYASKERELNNAAAFRLYLERHRA